MIAVCANAHNRRVNPQVWLSTLTRFIRWHRRAFGVAAAALCLVAMISALSPAVVTTRTVLVAAHPLPAGVKLATDDVTTLHVSADVAIAESLNEPAAIAGQVLAVPRPAGAVLTASDFVGEGLIADSDGLSLVPFRIGDRGVAGVLSVGNQISVVGANSAGSRRVIASRVRIAALPSTGSSSALGGESSSDGALILVAADPVTARELAAASTEYTLTVILESS